MITKSKEKPEQLKSSRSRNMARIRSANTAPEKLIRSLLFSAGYRFRLYAKDLPGRPDIIFRSRKKAIFVNGCFWHQHQGCRKATLPATNQAYWLPKLERNKCRDAEVILKLQKMGWGVLTIWECELKDSQILMRRLKDFLAP